MTTIFNKNEMKLVDLKTKLSFMASLNRETAIYQTEILKESLVCRLRERSISLGIDTKQYPMMQLGSTGGLGILSVIIDFYHNHEVWFSFLIAIPGLVNLIKKIVTSLVNLYFGVRNYIYRLTQDQHEYLPKLDVYVRAEIDTRGGDEYTRFDLIKRGTFEVINLIPVFKQVVSEIHPELPARFHITIKSIDTNFGIQVYYYLDNSNQKMALLRRISKLTKEHNTYTFSFYKSPILKAQRLRTVAGEMIW